MRRTKRFAGFALAACMGVSLLVNVPAGTVSAAEQTEMVASPVAGAADEEVPAATETDAEALDEAQEVVYAESEADADGFVWYGTTIVRYVGKGGDVKIPEKCTSIGDDGFQGCSSLTSIEIPSGVTRIGSQSFSWCENLESIVVAPPNAIYNSDSGCNAIIETKTNTLIQGCKNTKIPLSVTSIGAAAFCGCSGLTSIEIPSGVTSVESLAFNDCSNLTSVKLPLGVTSIDVGTFYNCSSLTSIEIPSSVTYIEDYAFEDSALKTIYGTPGSYAETYAKTNRYEFIDVANKPNTGNTENPGVTPDVTTSYRTHVQSFGWQNWVLNGAMSGTSGKAKRLEGINIKLSNAAYAGGIQYRTHVQTYGWEKEWKKDGAMSGTSGEAKRLEAIQIKLYGEMANHFDVYYRVHAQSYGWLGWAKNGEESGTAGFAKRLEGIQIVLVPKGGAAPANNYMGIQSVNTKAYIKK